MTEGIYCSRCERELPTDAFAPSQRKDGCYCRQCRAEYQAAYQVGEASRDRKTHVRRCKDCNGLYERWCTYKRPGSAGPRCKPCYLEYMRLRPSQPKPTKQRKVLTHGRRPSGERWEKAKAEVWATETHCGICGEYVDQAIADINDPMARTVDHITPITYGGAMYDRSNLRLAHRRCNCSEGNKLPPIREVLLRAGLWIGERMQAA